MATALSEAAPGALAATNWRNVDAISPEDIARRIAPNPSGFVPERGSDPAR
jgi:hypothetical protein